ncbi:glycoside hydrolase family 73 protein [Companilactobacillus pabuli]|uniref:Glycoside hydrolase family 73 protein n=1 Tax=Companilactobacillus pabuli TaxID=2714036 RepID=A0A7L7KWF6_9LACO|nr:glycoside hydrolase family 73 protein [Companilactobacillus pabuli]AKP03314.1 N-acetylmuramidase [Companilactobacillus farciminis]AKS51613.1 N-acetylmuramidase [Companilactobacillus farciminis]MDG5112418.1 glycoside hydrolase family 73 protein [Companilactobacillus pabuli]QMT83394.1 glycoside hydrolase family 73 protein [Companilactobacillus pabuli]GAQ01244.1 N-acetylmuramoyl-L-alanine amidase [Companilactobacillus farciminis]
MPQKRRYTAHKSYRRKRSRKNNNTTFILLAIVAVFVISFFGYRGYVHHQNETKVEMVQQEHNSFVKKVAPYAVELGQEYGVLPSITIAQAILESDWGTSTLASQYNNYFGIKGEDPNNTKVLQTKEYTNGQWITINGRFRVYSDFRESMKDHTKLLVNGTSWNSQQYKQVIQSKNYIDAAVALQTDGYATDPGYTSKIIRIIQKYNLKKYDQGIK